MHSLDKSYIVVDDEVFHHVDNVHTNRASYSHDDENEHDNLRIVYDVDEFEGSHHNNQFHRRSIHRHFPIRNRSYPYRNRFVENNAMKYYNLVIEIDWMF